VTCENDAVSRREKKDEQFDNAVPRLHSKRWRKAEDVTGPRRKPGKQMEEGGGEFFQYALGFQNSDREVQNGEKKRAFAGRGGLRVPAKLHSF